MTKITYACACILTAAFVTSCGSLPLTLPMALPLIVSSAGGGIAYTVTNVAYKTFSYPIDDVERAAHRALERMEISETGRESYEDGVRITASIKKLTVYIDLEELTPTTTKVRVNVKRGLILKDKATATEILVQTGRFLESPEPTEVGPVKNEKGGGSYTERVDI